MKNLYHYFNLEAFARDLEPYKSRIIDDYIDGDEIEYYNNMDTIEFAKLYIVESKNIKYLAKEVLERYFDYDKYRKDLNSTNTIIK
ncbi:hypothetical protein [Clostridioides difficile]|uniref:hypothetical protein n=1 Tax=Clostridioides difficile TaxID=1496 RepID=UPI00229859F4|nr:hypothetical protein [Clostridioides difficile]HCU2609049.1 hypothetical protein [Clostridioides difficile]HCU2781199.1 hypothetical protein [Clostridioides difficile]HCU3082072.1 hypothetical protein [Clostridioides difficile]